MTRVRTARIPQTSSTGTDWTRQRDDLAASVAELVSPTLRVETIFTWTKSGHEVVSHHRWQHPSLLDQLGAAAAPALGGMVSGSTHAAPDGRPAANLDALEMLDVITDGAAYWLSRLNGPPHDTVAADLGRLCGVVSSWTPTALLGHLVAAADGWVSGARAVTGWGRPGSSPQASGVRASTCPICGHEGSLRIRPYALTARCDPRAGGCGERWTPDNIALLARHLQAESGGAKIRSESVPDSRDTGEGGFGAPGVNPEGARGI
jgi:hypothetical protein